MKLGIIGSGLIVQEFLPDLIAMADMEILAIQGTAASRDTVKNLCARYQIPYAVCSFEELCATGIDTVYVAVPNFLHFEYCRKARSEEHTSELQSPS